MGAYLGKGALARKYGKKQSPLLTYMRLYYFLSLQIAGAPKENIVQNHLNIALLNVF